MEQTGLDFGNKMFYNRIKTGGQDALRSKNPSKARGFGF